MRDLFTPADPLSEALRFLRMNGVFYCSSELTAPWALDLPAMPGSLLFHVVLSGCCWVEAVGTEASPLRTGDIALVPHGEGHRLASGPGVPAARLFDLPREELGDKYEILRYGAGGTATHIVCAAVRFDHPGVQRLVAVLPRVISLETGGGPHSEWVRDTLHWMAAEARHGRLGGDAVVTRLADVLLIQAIRSWIERDPAAQTGWLGALQDRQLGQALSQLHRDPARPWTVESLAAHAAMSRSAFAARFAELVGEPPMQYLARLRMELALTALREEDVGLAALSSRLGYQSEAAFSRAFKRFMGVSPGAVRQFSEGR